MFTVHLKRKAYMEEIEKSKKKAKRSDDKTNIPGFVRHSLLENLLHCSPAQGSIHHCQVVSISTQVSLCELCALLLTSLYVSKNIYSR